MHIFMNALAASAGGGLTYVRNVLPLLAQRSELRLTVAANPAVLNEISGHRSVNCLSFDIPSVRRMWFEQLHLPKEIHGCKADVLLSAGNFALMRSPVPQILLSRNSIYTSADFYRDLWSRHEYRNWLDTHMRALLAARSIHKSNVTVAPSEAFAADLRRWTGISRIVSIHHGFDPETFNRDSTPLPNDLNEKLECAAGSTKLLFVSHYNYYRNFETLIRALPLIRQQAADQPVRVILTCKLAAGQNPGSYDPGKAADLVNRLGVADMVIELGAVQYSQLHRLYRHADLYVTPAYTETFAHPLVEAMSCGLPVVASDLPVHKEICREAALYFPPFSEKDLAARVLEVMSSKSLSTRLAETGKRRSADFSWKRHVQELLLVANSIVEDPKHFVDQREPSEAY
ncbi:MAG TPA: glycosyltransferase family 1 protein [Candidatus Sulfotelmatobacter sp.]|nr:glycosyltransferase family 1 protein [Candidatus Sulfotelmatobacter sp.]